VSVNLAPLALHAGPGHLGDGLGHLWPAEPSCDEVAGRPHPRVVYGVERLENRLPVLQWYQRAENPCRNVPKQRGVSDCLGCDLQCGGAHHRCHLRAGPLVGGHRRKVDRLRIGDGSREGPFRSRQPLLRPVIGGGSGRRVLFRRRRLRGRRGRSAQGVRYHVLLAWGVSDV
jgi:hypothetical protein